MTTEKAKMFAEANALLEEAQRLLLEARKRHEKAVQDRVRAVRAKET